MKTSSRYIYITIWYNLYGLPKSDLNKKYYSPISYRDIVIKYDVIVQNYLKNNLIELDNHDSRYKVKRNFRNKVIIFILKIYLIYIVGDKKSYYAHLKQQLKNHLSRTS